MALSSPPPPSPFQQPIQMGPQGPGAPGQLPGPGMQLPGLPPQAGPNMGPPADMLDLSGPKDPNAPGAAKKPAGPSSDGAPPAGLPPTFGKSKKEA